MSEGKLAASQIMPLSDAEWSPELGQSLAQLGAPSNIHRLLANHPQLLLAWMPFRNYFVGSSSLTDVHRELIILRYAALTNTDYEWQHHVLRGIEAGLTARDIECTRMAPDDVHWKPREACLLRAVDELVMNSAVGMAVWQELALYFSDKQRLDLLFTVGAYATLAMVIHTNGIEMDVMCTEVDLFAGTSHDISAAATWHPRVPGTGSERNMISDSETLIDEQLGAYNARDLTRFVATYADDVEIYRPPEVEPVIRGARELADFYQTKRFCHPELRAEVVNRLVNGNLVSDHERILGLPGGTVEVFATYEVVADRIRRVWLFAPSAG